MGSSAGASELTIEWAPAGTESRIAPNHLVALLPTQFGSICRSLERRKRAKLQRSDRSGCAALAPSLKSMEDPGGDVAIRFAVMIGSWRIESRPVELASRQPQS